MSEADPASPAGATGPISSVDATGSIAERWTAARRAVAAAAVAAGRDPGSVRLLLATKTVAPDRIRAALAAGAELIGENRVQEIVAKHAVLQDIPHHTHMIGHLQRNKINAVVGLIDGLQSLDDADTARRLNARCEQMGRPLDVMVQVNVSGEPTKSGVAPDHAGELVAVVAGLSALRLVGYMTVGLNSPDTGAVQAGYLTLAQLREQLSVDRVPGTDGAVELSMGMSGDFAVAIAAGATIVRLGTAVFGAR